MVTLLLNPEYSYVTLRGNHTMKDSLQTHRRRMTDNGIRRVEVCVREQDAELIRRVARALAPDDRASERLRAIIQSSMPKKPTLSFKEWLETP